MATKHQELGSWGETIVTKKCRCPGCKRLKTLKKLPTNFKCADVICDFCGFLAQVKTMTSVNFEETPKKCLGAAWGVQKARMDSGIFFPLYLVLAHRPKYAIFYLSADLQIPELFIMRKPLSADARRSGWQGFYYDFSQLPEHSFVRLI